MRSLLSFYVRVLCYTSSKVCVPECAKMSSTHRAAQPRAGAISGEVTRLLAGLERQKAELGPIAEELLELLYHMGGQVPPAENVQLDETGLEEIRLNPSSG